MADEQIIVDIKVEDKEIRQAEKAVDKLTDSIEELSNGIKDARNQNKEFKKQQEELNKLYSDGKITTEKYEKGITDLNAKIKINNKQIAESSIELGKNKTERTANLKLLASESNSRDELRQKIALLSREYNGLNLETKEGREQSEKLQKELKDLSDQLNKGSKAAGNFKDNIGNYPEILGNASFGMAELGDGMEAVGGSSANAVGGIKSLGSAFKALLANPVVLVLAAIVGALAALFSAFKKSETGSKLLSKAMAGLSGVMSVITQLADAVAKGLSSAFEEPQQSVKDLWEVIKENIVNRFKGIVDLFVSLGSIIKNALTGNLEELEAAAKDAGTALIQISTGFDKEQQKAIGELMKETAIEAARLADIYMRLEEAQRLNRGAVRSLQKDIAKLSAEFEMLSEVAGDDTRNLQEMRQAAIDAGAAAAKLAEKQVSLASARLSIIAQEVAARRSAGESIEDLLDEQAQAEVELTEARSQAAVAQQKILIEQRKIERDIFEQNLDILLDVGDKIKSAQEKAIQNESLSLDKRKQLLEGSRAALAANFSEIKKEYELYGITAEQINEVIIASDAKQTNEKLKALGLNEIANNRLREIILERRQADLDYADLSKTLDDEGVERKQVANEKIQEINDNARIREIEGAEEIKNALVELENGKLEFLLENENLLYEEKELLKLESQERIREIEEEFAEEQAEIQEEQRERQLEIIEEQFQAISDITKDFAGEQYTIFAGISEGIAAAYEGGKVSAEGALEGIGIAADALFESQTIRRAQDLANSDDARKKELLAAGNDAEAKKKINAKYDKEQAKIKREQWYADRNAALINVAIQAALGIVKSIGNVGMPAAIPMIVLTGITAAISAGTILSQSPPKFAGGTNDIVNIGDSHASGNDVDVWGYSGSEKQYFGKVERGEAMPVIKKSAANEYAVAKLNGKFGSRNKSYFQDGTTDIINQGQGQSQNVDIASSVAAAMQSVTIVAKIEDITKQSAKKMEIVNNSLV